MPSDRFDKLRPLRFAQHLALAAQVLELKRFLAMQRFRRSVYEIAAGGDGRSVIASDLGFSDQAHLTREFRRHAGVTPGAFRQAWCRPRAQAVRFLQDAERSTRLMMAVWPLGTTTEAG